MILEMKDVSVEFTGMRGSFQALKNISLSLSPGEILGIVGESGSGKSVTALSILNLLGNNAKTSNGEILFKGTNLLKNPKHPYTIALLHALPDLAEPSQPLQAIPGEIIDLHHRPSGCAFAARCPKADEFCWNHHPLLEEISSQHYTACWKGE